MTFRNKFLIGAIGLVALASAAIAQVPGLFIASPTGLEQIRVIAPSTGLPTTGSEIVNVTINQIRNASGYVTVAAGTTVNTVMTTAARYVIATGAITTWNITLPASPFDGEIATMACPGGNTGTLTIAAATTPASTSIVGTNPTSCTAATGGGTAFQYSLSANTWYRV